MDRPERLGRYKIIAELGKGAMGVVYEGLDPNIGRRVAIKTARRDLLEKGHSDELMVRFLREARAAGALNHPNIVTIYDADEQDDIAYIAMEFLDGEELDVARNRLRAEGPERIVEIIASLCEALAHAHAHGVIHRDVKPANIILCSDGNVKITDFGIAHLADSNLTREGAFIGTPNYMSPEQFRGQKIDGRADLFSVGVIAYELLTGKRPFSGNSITAVMHNVLQVEPPPPIELNPDIPEALNRVVMKSLSKDPNDRYSNGERMAAAFREALKPNPDPAVLEEKYEDYDDDAKTIVGTLSGETVLTADTVVSQPEEAKTVLTGGEATVRSEEMENPPVSGGTVPGPLVKRHKRVIVGAAVFLGVLLVGVFLWFVILPGAGPLGWGGVTVQLRYYPDGYLNPSQPVSGTVTITELDENGQPVKVLCTKELDEKGAFIAFPPHSHVRWFRVDARNDNLGIKGRGESNRKKIPATPGQSYGNFELDLE